MAYEELTPMLERIKMVTGFIATPNRAVETVFDLEDSYLDSPQMTACVERMKADPEMGRRIAEGYTTPDYDPAELINLPRDTLGYAYAKLLKTFNYAAHFYRDRELKTDADYCIMRMRKTHDIHHAVTGFVPRGHGETGVIAVSAYQFGYPAYLLIDLAAMASSVRPGGPFQQTFDWIGVGMKLGRDCKPLAGVKWEEGWDKPLAVWREELGIKAVTAGDASWYEVPDMLA
jgi:ubiquinone biosynthesis protein Coq4